MINDFLNKLTAIPGKTEEKARPTNQAGCGPRQVPGSNLFFIGGSHTIKL
jgi:hypothetical protein